MLRARHYVLRPVNPICTANCLRPYCNAICAICAMWDGAYLARGSFTTSAYFSPACRLVAEHCSRCMELSSSIRYRSKEGVKGLQITELRLWQYQQACSVVYSRYNASIGVSCRIDTLSRFHRARRAHSLQSRHDRRIVLQMPFRSLRPSGRESLQHRHASIAKFRIGVTSEIAHSARPDCIVVP